MRQEEPANRPVRRARRVVAHVLGALRRLNRHRRPPLPPREQSLFAMRCRAGAECSPINETRCSYWHNRCPWDTTGTSGRRTLRVGGQQAPVRRTRDSRAAVVSPPGHAWPWLRGGIPPAGLALGCRSQPSPYGTDPADKARQGRRTDPGGIRATTCSSSSRTTRYKNTPCPVHLPRQPTAKITAGTVTPGNEPDSRHPAGRPIAESGTPAGHGGTLRAYVLGLHRHSPAVTAPPAGEPDAQGLPPAGHEPTAHRIPGDAPKETNITASAGAGAVHEELSLTLVDRRTDNLYGEHHVR